MNSKKIFVVMETFEYSNDNLIGVSFDIEGARKLRDDARKEKKRVSIYAIEADKNVNLDLNESNEVE
jgi:hypothetical protein